MCNSLAKIKEIIDNTRERAHFEIMEGSPEDFVEGRTDWDELADSYRTLYYALIEIEYEVRKFIKDTKHENVT